MAEALNTDDLDRALWPYAVECEDNGTPVFLHFSDKGTADLTARLMGETVTGRWVTLDTSLPLAEGDNGWRKVSEFVL